MKAVAMKPNRICAGTAGCRLALAALVALVAGCTTVTREHSTNTSTVVSEQPVVGHPAAPTPPPKTAP